jgi:hypothetical protein
MSATYVDIMQRGGDTPFAHVNVAAGSVVVHFAINKEAGARLFTQDPAYLDALITQLEMVRAAWAAQRSEEVA